MLAQVALIVFAMCAVLSLVVDIGVARLTQSQMQNAADAAALDGIRLRNVGVPDSTTPGATIDDSFASDCVRRASANRLAHWVFDDDFDPTNGDPAYQFGAGPIVDMTDGTTSLHAMQTMTVPDAHVYKPDLQMNRDNQIHGDMVSGQFIYTVDPFPSEDATYTRTDFTPGGTVPQAPGLSACPPPDQSAPDPWPLSGQTGNNDPAFLVRLRRSNEFQNLGTRTDPDVASTGPSIPLMFGKGATIAGDDANPTYSPRRDGLTVRATAIAQVRPALHVGLPQTIPFMPGVAPFVLRDTYVATLSNTPTAVAVNPLTGLICTAAPCVGLNPPNVVGRFVAAGDRTLINTVGRCVALTPCEAGEPVPPGVSATACATLPAFSGYGPVASVMASTPGAIRVIGFAVVALGRGPAACPVAAGAVYAATLSRAQASIVADANATANVGALPLPIGATHGEVVELMDKNLVRDGSINYGPILVPALAR